LSNVTPYISKLIYHIYETTAPHDWDKAFSSTTALVLTVLKHLPAELQVSANFRLSEILSVLFRKGALLPFLKEVMPIVWDSVEVCCEREEREKEKERKREERVLDIEL
jgi:hypothetical protein